MEVPPASWRRRRNDVRRRMRGREKMGGGERLSVASDTISAAHLFPLLPRARCTIPRHAASSGTSNEHLCVCEDADGSIPAAYLFARSPAPPVYVTTNCQLLTTNCNRPLFHQIVRISSAATSIRLNANIFLPKSLRDAPR